MARIADEEPRISNPNDFNSQVAEFAKLKTSIDALEERAKLLRDKIIEQIENEGEEDLSGWKYQLPSAVAGIVRIEKQRRVSRKIDETVADELIAEKGLEDLLYKTIRVIDEQAIMSALYEDKLTETEVDRMFPIKETWALVTKKK
jgi:hypothetical protein